MKSNEVRVGNFVLFSGVKTKVIPQDFATQCRGINSSEMPNFEPIPLAEEWLLKSGAKKKKSCFVYDRFTLLYSKTYKFFSVGDTETGAYFTKVEFLHEWQNFIYTVNGVELFFSTERI